MRVVLLGDISGTRDGQAWPPRGTEVDLPDAEAQQLCVQRMAAPVVVTEMVETAVAPTVDVERRAPLTTKTGPGRRARTPEPAPPPD